MLERAAARRDAEWKSAAEHNRRRVRLVLSVPAAAAAIVVLLGIVLPVLFAVGGVLLALWLGFAVLVWRRAADRLVARLGGLTPDEAEHGQVVVPLGVARLVDLSEGLCAVLGLRPPALRVLDDPAANAITVGLRHDDVTLIVTAGLLEQLDRIELEGVIAHELAHVKRFDVVTSTLASSALGTAMRAVGGDRLLAWLVGPDREVRADVASVATTRYPPGLIEALEHLGAVATTRPSAVPAAVLDRTGDRWLAPVGENAALGLAERLDVLREL